jgi:glycosyltransferase involved in cell wall biosynthesis
MDISIIICTYNRSENLKECFDCLASQEITHGFSWEVILVDNNSSDQTKEYTKNYAKNCNFLLRYDFELKQGLSHARNHGIKTSNGDILIFIDDDIRVSIQWLQSIYNTFKAHQCDAVGGRIHIESESNLPKFRQYPASNGWLRRVSIWWQYGYSPLSLRKNRIIQY